MKHVLPLLVPIGIVLFIGCVMGWTYGTLAAICLSIIYGLVVHIHIGLVRKEHSKP